MACFQEGEHWKKKKKKCWYRLGVLNLQMTIIMTKSWRNQKTFPISGHHYDGVSTDADVPVLKYYDKIVQDGKGTMTINNERWMQVEEKLEELHRVVEENRCKGEWELAVLGTGIIRVVEQSKVRAEELRQRADDLSRTFEILLRKHQTVPG